MKEKQIAIILIVLASNIFPILSPKSENCYVLSFKNKTSDSEIPGSIKAVNDFLVWYKKNYEDISKISLIDNFENADGIKKPYRVNFKSTNNYLEKLVSSGFISLKYVEKWRAYFVKKDEYFQSHPQKEGPPMGFEFDFVLWTQDIQGTLNVIDKLVVIEVDETEDNSFVKVDIGMILGFHLTKHNNKWLIDDIENL